MKVFFSILLISFSAHAQIVDRVRLGYSNENSDQIGMTVSPDGKHIAFIYQDKTIRIFDVTAEKFVRRFTGPFDELLDARITSDGKLALIKGNEVQVINWKTGEILKSIVLDLEATKVDYAARVNVLAIGQMEGKVSVWDLNKLTEIGKISYPKHHVSALALHPDGTKVAVGVIPRFRGMNSIKLFDIGTGKEIAESATGIYTVANFFSNGEKLFTGGWNTFLTKKLIKVLDGNTLATIREFTSSLNALNMAAPYSGIQYEDHIFTSTAAKSLDVYDLNSGEVTFTTKADALKSTPFWVMGIGPTRIYPIGNTGKFIMNVSGNNINQIYSAAANSIIGYFFADSNEDYAVVSRDGRMDGTTTALSKVYWTSKNSLGKTSLESTFDTKFSPRLFSEILFEENSGKIAFDADEVIEKIPVLALTSVNGTKASVQTFETTQKKSQVELAVSKNISEVVEVKLFQNSKLVKVLPNKGNGNYEFDISLSNSFGEENYFYAVATSRAGIESEKAKFTIRYKGATDEKPTLYLLTIGINQYKNPKYNLNYAQADADGVDAMISESSSSLFKQVLSYKIRNDKALKSSIFAALEEIKKKSLEQDMLIVYYAGHGVMSESKEKTGEFFIIPYDITQLYGKDELLFQKAISANDLKQYAQEINAQKQVFILDACQSAGALEAMERGAAEEKAIAQLARSTGSFWITSTGSDQFASEFSKLGHGVFTAALLEGLKGPGDANSDKKLTIRELSTYIENRVPELSEQLKGTPQYPSAYSFGNDFPLVVFRK